MKRTHHEPGCPRKVGIYKPCTCAELEDELVPDQLPAPNMPHQSLASLIRAARTAGLLRPIQQYGGGHATAAAP